MISNLQAKQPVTRSRTHCLRERLLSDHRREPLKANPELTRLRNVTTRDHHQLNPPECLTLCLASQSYPTQDKLWVVALRNYPLDMTLASVVMLPNMDDLIDPVKPCDPTPPACRETHLLQEHVEVEVVRDHQNTHLVTTDAITTADLNLRPW